MQKITNSRWEVDLLTSMAVDPVQSFETFEATISLFNPFGLRANEFIAHHQKESKRYVM